jgi:hypothetical protein
MHDVPACWSRAKLNSPTGFYHEPGQDSYRCEKARFKKTGSVDRRDEKRREEKTRDPD